MNQTNSGKHSAPTESNSLMPDALAGNYPTGEKVTNTLTDTSESFGRLLVADDQPSYVGGAHWEAVLESIAGLKDSLKNSDNSIDAEPIEAYRGPELLLGDNRKATRLEILSALPTRPVVDSMIENFFHSFDMAWGTCLPLYKITPADMW